MPGNTIVSTPAGRSMTLIESTDAVGPEVSPAEEAMVAVGMTDGVSVEPAKVPEVAVGMAERVSVETGAVSCVALGIADGVCEAEEGSEAAGVLSSPCPLTVGVAAAWPMVNVLSFETMPPTMALARFV